jgi:hypothetical protein
MRGKVLLFSSALLAVVVAWAAFRMPSVDLDSALAGKRVLVCGASQGIGTFHEERMEREGRPCLLWVSIIFGVFTKFVQ